MKRIIQQPIFESFTAYHGNKPVFEIIALDGQAATSEMYNELGSYKPNYTVRRNNKPVVVAIIID